MRPVYVVSFALMLFLSGLQASAQTTVAPTLRRTAPEATIRDMRNAWTVGLAAGQLEGTYPRFANELSLVLNDGNRLRVMPFLSFGGASNVEDLLYMRNVDVALTQADALEYFRRQRRIPGIERRISYIIRLYDTELHLLARPEIKSFEDLRGKKVVFGPPGNSSSLTGPIVFEQLGVQVEPLFIDHGRGLEMMRSNEAAALVRVVGKPVDFFRKMSPDDGFRLLSIPFETTSRTLLGDLYTLGELTHQDYPNLIQRDQKIDTISVATVLAAINAPRESERYRRIERFIEALFTKWDQFQNPAFHPKWRDLNLAAQLPGWTRHEVAVRMLARVSRSGPSQDAVLRQEFRDFMRQRGGAASQGQGAAIDDALFERFLLWRQQSRARVQ